MVNDFISNYNLSPPSEARAVESLERVLGPQEAERAWRSARQKAGLGAIRAPLTLDQLRRVAVQMAHMGGIAGVLGTALKIRVETYCSLAEKAERPQ